MNGNTGASSRGLLFRAAIQAISGMAVILLLLWQIDSRIIQPAFRDLENRQALNDAVRARSGIEFHLVSLGSIAADWANRDDTYAFALDRNRSHVESNFSDFALLSRTSAVDLLAIYDRQGKELLLGNFHPVVGKAVTIRHFSGGAPELLPLLAPVLQDALPMEGILRTSHGPILIVARPVYDSQANGPSRGMLVVGRFLTLRIQQDIARRAQVPFDLLDSDDARLRESEKELFRRSVPSGQVLPAEFRDGSLYHVLPDIENSSGLLLRIPVRGEITALGARTGRVLTATLAAIALCLLICLVVYRVRMQATEQSLRKEQGFSASLLDSLPGIFFLTSYPELRMVLWNREHERLLGRTAREIAGRQLPEWFSPASRDQVVATLEATMADGAHTAEAEMLAGDGRLVPIVLNCVRFEAQGKRYLMGTGIDISGRKQAEEALLRSENKLTRYAGQMEQFSLSAASMLSMEDEQLIFAKISQAIVEYSDFRRVLISLFKDEFPYRDIIGHGGVDLETVERIGKIPLRASWYDQVFAQGIQLGRFSYYIPHTMKDILNQEATVYGSGPQPADEGSWHPEDNLFVRMSDDRGKFIGVISVDDAKSGLRPTDEVVRPLEVYSSLISQIVILKREQKKRRRLEDQLRQAQKMESVGRLAGGVAHDFNNMLSVILGHTEMLMEDIDPLQPQYADLLEIRRAAERSADITRQLLAFARKQAVVPRVIDLNAAIEGMLKMLRRLIGEEIGLTWSPGYDLWPVRIDPSQVDQILANLCVNARDAIAGIGEVGVETGNVHLDEGFCALREGFLPGEYVRIAVSDSGGGMDPETQSHIFEPFYTTKGIGEGTGLGLATVYGIVKQNDGFIEVESTPGRGTRLTIYLPRHGAELEPSPPETEESAGRGYGTVLLVEDEPTTLQMAATMLHRLGYSVVTAGRPQEALARAGEHPGPIDLLITDVIMPEMNGRELATKLIGMYPGMKCLFMSGYGAEIISRQDSLDRGAHFIQKPFTKKALAEGVEKALSEGAIGE